MTLLAPRWRKVIRDLWNNKSRTILVVMSIAVGILAVGVVSGSRETIVTVLNETFAVSNPPSGEVVLVERFGDNMVETIRGMREVAAAEGRAVANMRYKLSPDGEWKQIDLTAADDYEQSDIARLSPQAGVWPPPEKGLLIERSSLAKMGVEIGDTIIVETGDQKEKKAKIVGTVYDPGGMPAAFGMSVSGYVSRDTLVWLGEDRDFNRLLYVVTENAADKEHITAVGDLISRKFENDNLEVIFVQVENPGEHPISSVLDPLLLILSGLGGLVLVLSGFLVVNTVTGILAQQTRQIGMMKAIGGRRGQIMELYFVMVFTYGVLALAVALPLGAVGAKGLAIFLLNFFNADLNNFTFPVSVLIVQVVIGLLLPVVVAIYPIVAGTRITVREAVSEYGVGKGKFGVNVIDRLLGHLRGISRPLMLSLRNTFRRKGRLALTLITLTLAGTTFITIFCLRASMNATVDDLMSAFGFEVMVVFDRDYRMLEVERQTAKIPGITGVESWGQATVFRVRPDGQESDEVTLQAPPNDTKMYFPDVVEGRWLDPEDTSALVVNTDMMDDEPDLRVGDDVVLKLNAKERTWQIVGVVQGTMEGPTVYANQTYFNRLTHNAGKANVVYLSTDQGAESREIDTQSIQEQFTHLGMKVQMIMSLDQMQAMIQTTFDFLVAFLLVMAMVMAVVGGLGLSGTMSMNVLERVREIGVMRAIGASDGAVLQLVLVEGTIIGLLSWLVGSIVALPLSLLLSSVLGTSLISRPLSYSFSWMGMGLWLVVSIVLAIVASYFPARNASSLTVREVLAYE